MCGIAGFAGNGQQSDLERAVFAIRRRGPDDQGFYYSAGMGFGFRRLSIIDVAGGRQPLSNEDGSIWIVMNGEIYGPIDRARPPVFHAFGHGSSRARIRAVGRCFFGKD